MKWKHQPIVFSDLPESEIPAELHDGLLRLSTDAKLHKIRLRWRPHGAPTAGYQTRDVLSGIEKANTLELAQVIGGYARELWLAGGCERRFEAQVRREREHPDDPSSTLTEWRSITFYIAESDPTEAEDATSVEHDFDDHEDTDDDPDDGDPDDDDPDGDDADEFEPPRPRPRPRAEVPAPRPRPHRPTPRATLTPPSVESALFGKYAGYVDLARSDPTAFAMLVILQSGDRTVDTLERLLFRSFDRFDRTLEHQGSHNQFINEALQTMTSGAGELASVGLDLFRTGLEQQANFARINQDTEIGKERNELVRDAVKQGTVLAQAAMMSNAAKQRKAAEPEGSTSQPQPPAAARPSTPTTPRPSAPMSRPSTPTLRPSAPTTTIEKPTPRPVQAPEVPELEPTAEDRFIESHTRQLLEQVSPEVVDSLRPIAPSVALVFDELRTGPVTAARVRELVRVAKEDTDFRTLHRLGLELGPELSHQLTMLLMQMLEGDPQ